jgi:hypothetical protein
MIRVAKRGYLEVPSRLAESCRGWEHSRLAGLSHHRWLIEVVGSSVHFLMKYHMIHSHWRFSFPKSFLRRLHPEKKVQWLFWDDAFQFSERTIHGVENEAAELERFVQQNRPYPGWRLKLDQALRRVNAVGQRLVGGVCRRLGWS